MIERLSNEPILVPALLTSLAILINDILSAVDGQTLWAAVPAVIGLLSRFFVTGPVTAAQNAADAQG